ncbi:hypothetical protein T8K17_08910 [Thalassobaculum sp. OXR-137]|uniref:hypothetical protein n=1 Tax=Thalassobaculum sp. OXR-137 TaxID=3100173 RepID=UPI002AC8A8DA|nr:hypothetical protein [Thalassobaculum sp. OXR-137]WPZ36256.1 hypothetical protein T8K17_08910 [Thalassobaculum sp. OXR-137]
MPLPAYVDNLDALPEAVRAHYVETEDGRWRLDAEGVEDVSGLKSALEKERAERKALKVELAARDGVEEAPAESEVAPEPEPEPVPAASEPDRAAALEARLLEAEARAAIQAAHGVPELLLPVVVSRLSVAQDGSIAAATGDGTTLSVAELVETLRADPVYGRAFDASGKGGSGAPVAGRGDAGPVTVSASDPRAVARHIADIAAGRVRLA